MFCIKIKVSLKIKITKALDLLVLSISFFKKKKSHTC